MAGRIFQSVERSPASRINPQDRKKIGGDAHPEDAFRLIAKIQIKVITLDSRDILKDMVLIPVIQVICDWGRQPVDAQRLELFPNNDQPIQPSVSSGMEQHAIHHAEDGRVGSDS
jgi:hypothetical protein